MRTGRSASGTSFFLGALLLPFLLFLHDLSFRDRDQLAHEVKEGLALERVFGGNGWFVGHDSPYFPTTIMSVSVFVFSKSRHLVAFFFDFTQWETCMLGTSEHVCWLTDFHNSRRCFFWTSLIRQQPSQSKPKAQQQLR